MCDAVVARSVCGQCWQRGNAESEVFAHVVVNAAGPRAFDLAHASCESSLPKPTVRSEGLYLLAQQLTKDVTVSSGSFGHFSFAPWRGHSMIGPTETAHRGAVSDWRLTLASIEKFLALIDDVARPQEPLTLADVKYAWGGLRPLTEATESTYESSRSAETFDYKDDGVAGLVTAAGGKYTTSRAFAEQVVDAAARSLGRIVPKSRTAREALDGCDVGRTEAYVSEFVDSCPALEPRTGLGTLGPSNSDTVALVVEVMAQELGWDDSTKRSEREAMEAATALPTH